MASSKTTFLHRLYPWLIWSLAASFFFYKYFIQVSPSVMSTELMHDFSLSGVGLGHLAASFFYAYLIMQIPVGLIIDRYSPRLILFIAVFLCAVSILGFAHTNTLPGALFSRFCIGIFAAFAAITCFKLITIWFDPKRFALMAGLSMTVAMLGAIGGEAPLLFMIKQWDWRTALEMVGAIGILLAIIIALVVPGQKTKVVQPEEYEKIYSKLCRILNSKQTWLLSLYSGLAFAPVSVFGGLWGVSFVEKAYHLPSINAASAVSLIYVGFAIGCPLSGWLSDYMQKRKPLMWVGTIVAFLTITCILYLPISVQMLHILLLLFGIASSCFFLCFSMIRELHSIVLAGTVIGVMNTFDALCEAITEPLVGKLLDISWGGVLVNGVRSFSVCDYHFGLLIIPVFLGISICLLFKIKETHCQVKQNED